MRALVRSAVAFVLCGLLPSCPKRVDAFVSCSNSMRRACGKLVNVCKTKNASSSRKSNIVSPLKDMSVSAFSFICFAVG
jgi:hypothetical protein